MLRRHWPIAAIFLLAAATAWALPLWPPDPDDPPPDASAYTGSNGWKLWRAAVYEWADIPTPALSAAVEQAWKDAHLDDSDWTAWVVIDGARAGYDICDD